jgi:hypothetical protein
MKKTLLWLDDIRNPRTLDWLIRYAPDFYYGGGNIVWVKSYLEFTDWINKNGVPDKVCFDHDLGENMSGYDAAKFLIDFCYEGGLKIPDWAVQSANPVGVKNINQLMENAKKHIG